MAFEAKTMAMVEEWRRKGIDISCRLNNGKHYDGLVSVLQRGFDTLSVIAKGCEYRTIQYALASLDRDRALCLQFEDKEEPRSLRIMMLGLIESMQGVLTDMTASREYVSVETQTDKILQNPVVLPLEPVIPLIRTSTPNITESQNVQTYNASLLSLEPVSPIKSSATMTEAMDVSGDDSQIRTDETQNLRDALAINEDQEENNDMDYEMDCAFLEESVYGNLSGIEIQEQPEIRPVQNAAAGNLKKPKTEPVDSPPVIHNLDQTIVLEDDMAAYYAIPEEEVDNFDINLGGDSVPEEDSFGGEAEEEEVEDEQEQEDNDIAEPAEMPTESSEQVEVVKRRSTRSVVARAKSISANQVSGDETGPSMKMAKSEVTDNGNETVIVGDEKKERRRSTRSATKRAKYVESDDESDEDDAPPMKKAKSEPATETKTPIKSHKKASEAKSESRKWGIVKTNETELECPDCEYRTHSVNALVKHLGIAHATTPKLAGIIFRCECGHDSYSDHHSRICDVSKITVVKEGDESIVNSRTPKRNNTKLGCPKCEHTTRTAQGLVTHLYRQHGTTLTLLGLAFRCECGHVSAGERHSKTCDISQLTVVSKEEREAARSNKKQRKSANFASLLKKDGPIRRLRDKKSPIDFALDEMEDE